MASPGRCPEICIRTTALKPTRRLGVRQTKTSSLWPTIRLKKRSKKRLVRYSLLVANVALLLIVSSFVIKNPTSSQSVNKGSLLTSTTADQAASPLDQLSSADIAVHVAHMTRLEETTSIVNKADTVSAQLAISPADDKVVAKPQVVATAQKSRKDIQRYVTQPGDTVASVATKFNVTSDSLRWSNSLPNGTLTANKELWVSPVSSGVVYLVKAGDTPEALAEKFRTSKEQIVAFNDAEVSGLPIGQRIIIPDGTQPVPAARGNTGVYSGASFAWGGFSAVYGGNGYDYGYCTWWAAVRRSQIGRPVPSNLGNASTWKILAQRAGFGVGNAAAAGAVIWTPPHDYYGHVGFVESVDADGTVHVSEMNVAGWGRVSKKTLSPAQAAAYAYIY